jgi:hypothetical protein
LPYTRNKATQILRDAGLVDGRDKYQVALAIYQYLQDTVTYVERPARPRIYAENIQNFGRDKGW